MPVHRDLVVIGASAGGVRALRELLAALPGDLAAAVVVVLHLAPLERSHLRDILQSPTELRVRTAADGEPLERGVVLVPVPDRHLRVIPDGVQLTRGPRECRARPAIDVLFRSAAVAYGPRTIGVLLTGMLDDGSAGLWAIKDLGGVALVQEPATAEHPGMPASAIQAVDVDFVGDLEALAHEIVRLAGTPVKEIAMPPSNPLSVEDRIGVEAGGMQADDVLKLGPASNYTCPSCHGSLIGIREGRSARFRCHSGHAYSMRTLLEEVDDTVDDSLWNSLRAIHERIQLLRQMCDIASTSGRDDLAAHYRERADMAERRLRPIQALLHDGALTERDLDDAP
jgi:two-component system chemotaxis response regulator CheB